MRWPRRKREAPAKSSNSGEGMDTQLEAGIHMHGTPLTFSAVTEQPRRVTPEDWADLGARIDALKRLNDERDAAEAAKDAEARLDRIDRNCAALHDGLDVVTSLLQDAQHLTAQHVERRQS